MDNGLFRAFYKVRKSFHPESFHNVIIGAGVLRPVPIFSRVPFIVVGDGITRAAAR